jgi:peptide chain release factor 1
MVAGAVLSLLPNLLQCRPADPPGAPMFEAVEGLVTERHELEERLADPATHTDQGLAKRLNQRYAEVSAIVRTWEEWRRLGGDVVAARELAADDPDFATEAASLEVRREEAEERLRHLLVPRDAADAKDAILEVKSGEGGEESALFAGDLLRMYTRYAERRGWSTEVLDATESDLGGYKSVTVAVKARGTSEPGEAPYGLLKFEAGVHRVQRVPVTESQGRVHTSAAGVLVLPEAEQVDVSVDENDLRIDVFRSSGPGGQSVNTTDSAVRITHLPTGIVVSCQNEKSQLQNRDQAMRILRARLLAAAQETADAEASEARRSQVRTVDRSERIRTYNYPENRISDHRTGYKAYNLDHVLDGDLDPVLASCVETDLAARLDALES